MSFTYYDSLTADRDKVRFSLQDTTLDKGPKPGDVNFTDAEIAGLLTIEGTWQRAVAAGFEVLAAAWRKFPTFATESLKLQRTDIAAGYAAQAKQWRSDYGYSASATGAHTAGGIGVIRQDAYSDDLTSVETAGLDGGEYA